jgi:hypothetical protein
MRLAEEVPAVDWSDADLADYARRAKQPIVYVALGGAIHDQQPDTALVNFFLSPPDVRRFKRSCDDHWNK